MDKGFIYAKLTEYTVIKSGFSSKVRLTGNNIVLHSIVSPISSI